MNSYPTTKIIFDRRKKASPDKEGMIEIEIYFQAKRKIFSTGISVLPKNWSSKLNRVIKRADSNELNIQIQKKEEKISKLFRKLMLEGKPFSWEDLDALMGNHKEKDTFITFVENRVNTRQDLTPGTLKNHRKFLKALKEFNVIRDFSHLTKSRIIQYDTWLHSRKVYTQSTVASYHKFMKVYINEAIRLEKISVNPYLGIKIDRGNSKLRKYLTTEEVRLIEEVELPFDTLDRVRDLFIFQCYTALAYADLAKFDFTKVVERNGRYVVHDRRHKTGEDFYIVLLPPAIRILKKYDYQLPVISNQQYNMRLKIVAERAGLTKKLTSHMARHTYATQSLNVGIPVEVLAKMMGHSDIKTTQIYAKLVNPTLDAAYDHLAKKICSK